MTNLNFIFLQFLQQYNHYKSNVEIFKLQPNKPSKELAELVMFMAQVRFFFQGWGVNHRPVVTHSLQNIFSLTHHLIPFVSGSLIKKKFFFLLSLFANFCKLFFSYVKLEDFTRTFHRTNQSKKSFQTICFLQVHHKSGFWVMSYNLLRLEEIWKESERLVCRRERDDLEHLLLWNNLLLSFCRTSLICAYEL